ncbi:MAG TPA: oligosaccharide flippase family protein [Candidatus Sulfotelmatobacter sp.]|nr:oligosaccharide flippase family protein [Candidatus Sulfotelmatobacter sp.]
MKALIVTLFTTGVLQLANLASGLLAARLLLPEGRGALAVAILWPTTLAYLLLFGLNDAVLFYSANRQERPERVFAAGLWLGITGALIAMAAGYIAVIPLAYRDYPPETRALATWLLLIIPLHILGMAFQEMLRGHHRMGAWNLLRVAQGVGYVAFILAALWLHAGTVEGFGIAYMLAHVPPLAAALLLCLAAGWGSWRFHADTARRVLRYGARIHLGSVVNMLNGRIDQMLVAGTLSAAAMGLYVVAVTLSQVTATLANSVSMAAWPRAAAAADAERPRVIGLYLRLTLVLLIGTTAALYAAAPLIVRLLFGGAFADATPIVRVLLLGAIPIAVKEFFVLAFKAYDRSLAISKGELATLVANVALLALLIPRFGLIGAATAYVAVRWLSTLYLAWLVRRELGLRLTPLLAPTREDLGRLADVTRRGLRTVGLRA